VLGALSACSPDLEHVVRLPRPGGRKLFPTHRGLGNHGGNHIVPAWAQLVAAALLLRPLLVRR
jgi:hypothetical protein